MDKITGGNAECLAIRNLNKLNSLDLVLSKNFVGDEGCKSCFLIFEKVKKLTLLKLYFRDSSVSDVGLYYLLKGVKLNK